LAALLDRVHLHAQPQCDVSRRAAGEQMLDILEELRRRELGLVLDAPQRGDGHIRSMRSQEQHTR